MKNNLITQINLFEGNGFQGFGPLGLETANATDADKVFVNFISSAIGLITLIAIIWFIFIFITGAIGFISASGDKAAIETAQKKIMNGIIGLAVVVLGIFVVRFIGALLGISDILWFGGLFSKL